MKAAATTPFGRRAKTVFQVSQEFQSFAEFYPYYLSEHQDRVCRRLHFVGTALVILTVLYSLFTLRPWLLLLAPLFGYGFAWVGHYFFEKNKPATFMHPLYSLFADFVMFKDIVIGRVRV